MSPMTTSDPHHLWKSLEEWEETSSPQAKREILEAIEREFPEGASIWGQIQDPFSRRRFLQIMGASIALAGITACTKMPPEKIIPYVVMPDELIPGKPQFFATSGFLNGYSKGILVESHEGRPTKIEGNPKHPSTLGKSDVFMQAELLQLYDPERARAVLHLGQVSTWDEFNVAILSETQKWKMNQGEGVRILTNPITSPTLLQDLRRFLTVYPKARWTSYGPGDDESVLSATELAFGQKLKPLYDFSKAEIVLSLDADFLGSGPAQEIYSRDFMSFRKSLREKDNQGRDFNRLYMIESSISITGACADHRWAVRPSEIRGLALALAGLLEIPGISSSHSVGEPPDWLRIAANDLKTHSRRSLVITSENCPPDVQALAFAINQHLGNFDQTLKFILENQDRPPSKHTLSALIQEMKEGKVKTLIVMGANPVYDTPATLRFKQLLEKVPLRIQLALHEDETSYSCHWFLPESHFLESWGDGRTVDGTATLQQPLISPLYATRSAIEVFSILTGLAGRSSAQAVKDYWHVHLPKERVFEEFFQSCLRDGFVLESTPPPISVRTLPSWPKQFGTISEIDAKARTQPERQPQGQIEATFRLDPTIWDGRYSNNAWLQELPKPILQLTWSNAVVLSPTTAKQLGVEDEDEVEMRLGDRVQHGPVLRIPGHPDGVATLYFGYGRTRAGQVGNKVGYNAYALQDHLTPGYVSDLKIRKLGRKVQLAMTHTHSSMEGRDIVVSAPLGTYQKNPDSIVREELRQSPPTLLPERKSEGEAWAMVIDLTVCIGCKTCTIACQAENNIPVVGKEEVRRSREMHWIRVDRYFQGNPNTPKILFQPVPCMHCEKAPCEVVCPTVATNHSQDGLNQMIYNRCVGTRYCSNNCPYKVRRFNFFQYSDTKTRSIQLMHNPDVTVRSRGVMEKCTYCVQRIQEARISAELEDRPIRDGEILTACQQACPTDAIIFGDQKDSKSRVSKLKARPHNYKLLNELGTQPRTTYLALIRNPNPSLGDAI